VAGCLTSILTSHFSVRSQTRSHKAKHERNAKQKLYEKFIDEASKIFVHALENSSTEVSNLINLYATLNEIRVVSSPEVVKEADKAVRTIIATYTSQNKTFEELMSLLDGGFPDPLVAFSETCRRELESL
jgi:ribosomal protein S17